MFAGTRQLPSRQDSTTLGGTLPDVLPPQTQNIPDSSNTDEVSSLA